MAPLRNFKNQEINLRMKEVMKLKDHGKRNAETMAKKAKGNEES